MPQILITREQLSKELQLTPGTIFRLTKKRIIPCYRIGKSIRYCKEEVLAAMVKSAKEDELKEKKEDE